jgi:hypothetical protein
MHQTNPFSYDGRPPVPARATPEAPSHHTNGTAADEAVDLLYSFWPAATPAPAPCPEAAFSLTLKGTLGGQEALLTARGQTAAEFKANLEAIRGLLDPVQPQPTPPASSPGEGWCRAHQEPMKLNEKNGQRWFSHRLPEGGFCKGK